jgi:DNA adenine methylase
MIKKPFTFYGGKGLIKNKIIPLLPPHREYVEPFAGSAAVFFAKKPALIETLNDVDGAVMNFYKVLRDVELFEKLVLRLNLTPYARDEYKDSRNEWPRENDLFEKAVKWFIANEMAFSATTDHYSWKKATLTSKGKMAECVSKYLNRINGLFEFHLRLRMAQIENVDFRRILKSHNAPSTLAYCDPPYLKSTRGSHGYLFEMTEIDHYELVQLLLDYSGMVVLSGYDNAIYQPLLKAGWIRTEIPTFCFAVGRTSIDRKGAGGLEDFKRLEIIWRNPGAMAAIQKAQECPNNSA